MDVEITQKPDSAVVDTPAESEEEKLILVSEHGPWPVQYKSRIPFDFNYYGDFYFASLANRQENRKAMRKAKIGTACDKSGGTDEKIVTYQRQDILDLEFETTFKICEDANDYLYIHQDHPNRDVYYMRVCDVGDSSRSTGNTWGAKLDWAYLELVRRMANVSIQFRLELGSVIWERSRLYCRGDIKKSALVHFLTASPGMAKGIKELVIDIALEECLQWENDSDESIKSFKRGFQALMELISQKLDLDCLTLKLAGTQSAIFNLAEGEGPMKILTNIRDLKVTKGFQVEIDGYTELDADGYVQDYKSDLGFKFIWEPKIREALLPDNLRPQRPETDRNDYLASRTKP
ncbi:hypothetical protein EAE96_006683 [Botrytis aclada]|nr:hypothetical protein EAE96_006683 [Botrytis aclada]